MKHEFDQQQHILIVDDIQSDRMLLEKILNNAGHAVLSAENGSQALDMAREHEPDLFLLDISMTPMDGYELCKHLKEESELANIPVIFISAKTETFDKVKAFQTGGVDYITKPYQSEEVIARANVHLRIHELQDRLRISVEQLEKALNEVKQLKGLLPICASCKNIRDDQGYWNSIESYIMEYSEVEFSHALCPKCIESLYPDLSIPPKEA